jgi:hypothetical protein
MLCISALVTIISDGPGRSVLVGYGMKRAAGSSYGGELEQMKLGQGYKNSFSNVGRPSSKN